MANYPQLDNAKGVWKLQEIYDAVVGGYWPNHGAKGLVTGGGSPSNTSTIDQVIMSTAGNATDFGDCTNARSAASGYGNQTRGIFAAGSPVGSENRIEYVTIPSAGNAADFGDSTLGRASACGASSDLDSGSDRGVFYHAIAAGNHNNTIDYVTISTTGNATDFGDGTAAYTDIGGTSDNSRGVILGGGTGAYTTAYNYIRQITIDTAGNASNLATLSSGRRGPGAASGSSS